MLGIGSAPVYNIILTKYCIEDDVTRHYRQFATSTNVQQSIQDDPLDIEGMWGEEHSFIRQIQEDAARAQSPLREPAKCAYLQPRQHILCE